MSLLRTFQKGPEPRPEAISQIAKTSFRGGVLLLLAFGLSGCATPALWKHTAARSWRPETSTAQFLVVQIADREDVVIVFDQCFGEGKGHKSRLVAWDLRYPSTQLVLGRKAVRQFTNACDRVRLMRVLRSDGVPADVSSDSPGYVVRDPQVNKFTVCLDGAPPGPFELPFTYEETRSGMRAAFLPLTVAADAAIVGAVCGGLLVTAAGSYH